MDFAQLNDAHVGVDLGGIEPGMTEHLLDEPDVGPVLQHVSCATVPKQVAGAAAPDVGGGDSPPDPVADKAAGQPLTIAAKE